MEGFYSYLEYQYTIQEKITLTDSIRNQKFRGYQLQLAPVQIQWLL